MTRSACVIAGVPPDQVTTFANRPDLVIRANKLGTLVTGKAGGLVIDLAMEYDGPVYDVMWNARTGWFAVTIYRGERVVRWDNRPDEDAGYPRVDDVLGATTPKRILEAIDMPAEAIGYAEA